MIKLTLLASFFPLFKKWRLKYKNDNRLNMTALDHNYAVEVMARNTNTRCVPIASFDSLRHTVCVCGKENSQNVIMMMSKNNSCGWFHFL